MLRCAPERIRPASMREWSTQNEPLDKHIQMSGESQKYLNLNPDNDNSHNEAYSPGTPLPAEYAPPSQQPSVMQPESENFPEIYPPPSQQATSEAETHSQPEFPEEIQIETIEPRDEPLGITELGDQDDACLGEPVFWRQDVSNSAVADPLHDWMAFHPGIE